MKNDNKTTNFRPENAQKYFRQFSETNIKFLRHIAKTIFEELETAPYELDVLGLEVYNISFFDSRTTLEPYDKTARLITKVGQDFRFCFNASSKSVDTLVYLISMEIVNKKNFHFFYKELNKFIENHLTEEETTFNNDKIILNNKSCSVPPDTMESEFCGAMYKLGKIDQLVEWYDIAEHIEGERPPKQESHQTQRPKDLERYHSAMRRVNERARECFGINELFTYKKRYFTRTK